MCTNRKSVQTIFPEPRMLARILSTYSPQHCRTILRRCKYGRNRREISTFQRGIEKFTYNPQVQRIWIFFSIFSSGSVRSDSLSTTSSGHASKSATKELLSSHTSSSKLVRSPPVSYASLKQCVALVDCSSAITLSAVVSVAASAISVSLMSCGGHNAPACKYKP